MGDCIQYTISLAGTILNWTEKTKNEPLSIHVTSQ